MIKKIEQKKGDLPVTILVIGIFAVCAFALLTFFMSDFKISNSFIGVSMTSQVSSVMDQYLFLQNHGVPQDKLNALLNISTEYGRNYVNASRYDTEGGFFGLIGGSKVLVFSVKYQVPSSAFAP